MGVRISPGAPEPRRGRRGARHLARGPRATETTTLDAPLDRAGEAAATPAAAISGGLEGFLGPRTVLGWAADARAPGAPVTLLLRLRGETLARLTTGSHDRPDLFAAVGPTQGVILDLPEGYMPGDLATGRLALHPLDGETMLPALPLRPRLLAQEQAAAGHALLRRAEEALGPQGLAEMLAVLGRPEGYGAARLANEANAALAARVRGARPREAALSPLHLPVGLRSANGSVVMGREGHLFLLAGSNGELARLGADPAHCRRLVDDWIALIAARKARAEAAGLRFIQLIVPEKATLAPSLLPDPAAGGPTPFLAALEAALEQRPELAACTLHGRHVMRAAARAHGVPTASMLRRLDSHPGAAGMHAMARAVLQQAGEEPPDFGDRFQRAVIADGDLREHLLPEPCFEEHAVLPPRLFARFGAEPALVEEHVPPDQGHIGRSELWRAEGAPSRRRLLAFGNSVCGTGRAGQGLLSGWLARWFAEYRFHWQPALDWDVVAAAAPDILLCQTVERFMGRVPAA